MIRGLYFSSILKPKAEANKGINILGSPVPHESLHDLPERPASPLLSASAFQLFYEGIVWGSQVSYCPSNNPGKSGNDVTLTGHVPTEDDKRVAEEIARSTKGVANVVNNLQVDPKTQSANAEKQ